LSALPFPEDVARGLSLLLGREVTGDRLLFTGERIVNLERLTTCARGSPGAGPAAPAFYGGAGGR